ncbi:hypothetical protein [Robbsia sp. KACC 23696]|uniref:hypothetical protein n=1 Tax=Robbsia sp. KACC 23696 TaxID=3149231 RepID=UPI00325BBF6E
MFVLLSVSASAAYADGPADSYDHSATAVARTLSPNEYLVNADGAQEDPDHRMSDVARAYRNGMIAGRKEAAAKQQAAGMPPLPPDMQSVTVTPPLVSHRYVYAEHPTDQAAPEVAQYQEPPQPQRVAPPPVQYVQQQNVYAPPQRYVQQPEYEEVEAYSPPPPPPPVYVQQPEPRYIVVQRPRRMWGPPPGYWQQSYYAPQPMGRPYAYQPY